MMSAKEWLKRNYPSIGPSDELLDWMEAYAAYCLGESNKWIPVGESFPGFNRAVLVWCPERRNTFCATTNGAEWYVFGGYRLLTPDVDVTHWRPLPNPPEVQP